MKPSVPAPKHRRTLADDMEELGRAVDVVRALLWHDLRRLLEPVVDRVSRLFGRSE